MSKDFYDFNGDGTIDFIEEAAQIMMVNKIHQDIMDQEENRFFNDMPGEDSFFSEHYDDGDDF